MKLKWFICSMATNPDLLSIVIMPNPREWPVPESIIIFEENTFPNRTKRSDKWWAVVKEFKLPTKMFINYLNFFKMAIYMRQRGRNQSHVRLYRKPCKPTER